MTSFALINLFCKFLVVKLAWWTRDNGPDQKWQRTRFNLRDNCVCISPVYVICVVPVTTENPTLLSTLEPVTYRAPTAYVSRLWWNQTERVWSQHVRGGGGIKVVFYDILVLRKMWRLVSWDMSLLWSFQHEKDWRKMYEKQEQMCLKGGGDPH